MVSGEANILCHVGMVSLKANNEDGRVEATRRLAACSEEMVLAVERTEALTAATTLKAQMRDASRRRRLTKISKPYHAVKRVRTLDWRPT